MLEAGSRSQNWEANFAIPVWGFVHLHLWVKHQHFTPSLPQGLRSGPLGGRCIRGSSDRTEKGSLQNTSWDSCTRMARGDGAPGAASATFPSHLKGEGSKAAGVKDLRKLIESAAVRKSTRGPQEYACASCGWNSQCRAVCPWKDVGLIRRFRNAPFPSALAF